MPNISVPTGVWAYILCLITIGFAIQQITVGHNLDPTTSLTLLYAGLAGGGISAGHTAGVNAANSAAAQAPPAPPAAPHV